MISSSSSEIQKSAAAVSTADEAGDGDKMRVQLATGKAGGLASLRPELSDLMARIARFRDRDAFQSLFVTVGPSVKGMLLRQGADHGTAEEIVQETFLMVWRKAEQYASDRGSASTWIYTIARNLRIDRLRREVPWQELTEDHLQQVSDEPLQDELLASHQIQSRMRSVLESLPADQTEVVMLAYVEGLSHGEIAARLGIPLGTVKSRMRLAYQKIKNSVLDAS